MTRIVAGVAGGRRLAVPKRGTRPTSDRVREALFSSLESAWGADGTSWSLVPVLDLYAGSGALGLEALSRGAPTVVLVERDRAALGTLRANVAAVGLPGAHVVPRDVDHLADGACPAPPAWLVLADPPYDVPAERVAAALAALRVAGWIAGGALVVVERPARDPISPLPDTWPDTRRRVYGDTVLWYGRTPAGGSAREGEVDEEGA
jgi:16S rRNA (guanine966-N2)-methyltransferase